MINTKPPKGTRDFLPEDVRRREYVVGIIKEVYEAHGFEPLETPSFERLETLLGKYGEEGDQLVFRIMHRGDSLQRALDDSPTEATLANMGLRYDLTVPLARVIAQHSGKLPLVFKRYQIQPVWRADRPQKGRYREFFQCDVDITGSESMVAETEVIGAVGTVLERLGFDDTRINLNHREILFGLLEVAAISSDQESDALIAIDKMDKIGWDGVERELETRGIAATSIATLKPLLTSNFASVDEALTRLSHLLESSERGMRGVAELRQLTRFLQGTPAASLITIEPSLARGLSYYTGPIYEVVSPAFRGSLGGGGRYDGLVGMFQKRPVPAVGFSLGLERLLVLMEEREMFPKDILSKPHAMVGVLKEKLDADTFTDATAQAVVIATTLRQAGLRVDLYPGGPVKSKKLLKHANNLGVSYAVLLGANEIAEGVVALKNMISGQQQTYPLDALATLIKNGALAE